MNLKRSLKGYISLLVAIGGLFAVTINQAQADDVPNHINIDGIFKPSDGSDSSVSDNSGIVQVTPDAGYQKGSIWSQEAYKMDLTHDFNSLMYINLGDKEAEAGDGMAFVMMNDSDKVKNWNQVTGGSIGVWRSPVVKDSDETEIKHSFAVEFDTHYNANELDGLKNSIDDMGNKSGMPGDDQFWQSDKDKVRARGHIAYGFPGAEDSYTKVPLHFENYGLVHHDIQIPDYENYLSNGSWHPFRIHWDSTNKMLTYQFDALVQQHVKLDPMSVFETDKDVYWGFTGSTGDKSELNQIIFTEVPGLNDLDSPATITSPQGDNISMIAAGKSGVKGTTTAYERQTVHYKITPTDLTTSAADITKLVADIQLDHTTYKPGTLKINGEKGQVVDSDWSKVFSIPVGTLTHSQPTKTIEFDATVDPLTVGTSESTGTDKITYNSNLLLNKQFELPYTIQPDGIHVKSPTSNTRYQLTSDEIAQLRTLPNQEAVAQALAKLAGLTAARKSDGAPVGLDKFKTTEDALTVMRNMASGSSITLHFQAPDKGLTSDTLAYTFSAPIDDGTLKFGDVVAEATFQNTQLGTTSVAMHNSDWKIAIMDTRKYGSAWQLMVALTTPFKTVDGSHQLASQLDYLKPDGAPIEITTSPVQVASGDNKTHAITVITDQWTAKTGLELTDISSHNYAGTYTGQLTWSLSDVPNH